MEEVKAGERLCCFAILLAVLHGWQSADAKPIPDRNVFCVQAPDKTWKLQPYAPLIDVHRGQTFLHAAYMETWLRTVQLRQFTKDYGMEFEYKFDEAGKLTALHGIQRVWGEWIARADLFPEGGVLPPPRLLYYRRMEGETIAEPEEAKYYKAVFSKAPIYKTIDEIPCAAMLKAATQAEKMNATQK